jgi:hypothetical protein
MMIYPSALDYKAAVLAPQQFLLDPVLRATTPVLRKGAIAEPYQISGGFARVYKFKDANGKFYAFRCWSADIGDTAKIYEGITEYLRHLNAACFIDFHFKTQSILVNGTSYPGMRMDWVEAPALQQFAYMNLNNPAMLEACAEEFLNVARYMHSVSVAHGDLQGDNIKVLTEGGTPRILLIDYDTMYVPSLHDRPAVSSGLASYQHPRRGLSTRVTVKDDYFSELVIYLGLIGLARCPSVRKRFGRVAPDKDLIFSAQDFAMPLQSLVFNQLQREGDAEVRLLTNALMRACGAARIDQLKPLEAVLAESEYAVEANDPALTPSIFEIQRNVSRRVEEEQWINPDVDKSVFKGPPPLEAEPPPLNPEDRMQKVVQTTGSGRIVQQQGKSSSDSQAKWALFVLVIIAILAVIFYAVSTHESAPPPDAQPQTQSTAPPPAPVDTSWNVRIDKETNVCRVQAAASATQYGEALVNAPTRVEACEKANSYMSFDPSDTIYCHDFTAATRKNCAAVGVTLPDKNGN